jgi:hypothetical protein
MCGRYQCPGSIRSEETPVGGIDFLLKGGHQGGHVGVDLDASSTQK